MLEYNGIEITEGIDINKTNASKNIFAIYNASNKIFVIIGIF